MVVGYICMMGPKRNNQSNMLWPLAYGPDDTFPCPHMLLRDRGATIFKTKDEAQSALKDTIHDSIAEGAEWPNTMKFTIIEVNGA